jgi:RHS repeat-associated protein
VTALSLMSSTGTPRYDSARRPVGVDWVDRASGGARLTERRLYGPRGEGRLEQLDDRLWLSRFDTLGRQTSADEYQGAAIVDVAGLAPATSEATLSGAGQADEDALGGTPPGAPASQVTYILDDATNRRQVIEVAGGAPALTVDYDVAPFDQYRKVGSDVLRYDLAGNTIGIGTQSFQFDAYHRLASSGATGIEYDALGRPHAIGGLALVHAGIELIEWRLAGQPAAQLVSAGSRYVHAATGGADYQPLADLAGTVVAWVDESGAVIGRSAWDPFGRLLARSGAWPVPIGFRAQWRDEPSGIDLLLARAYHPGLGRFLQRDPLGYLDGPNLYAYARHAPSTFSDAFGFASTEIHWGTVAWNAVKTAGLGVGVGLAAGFAVTTGIVSAPFVLAVGGLYLLGSGLRSFFRRADEAFDAGKTDFAGRAALTAAGDALGLSGLWEGATGRDAVTDRRLGSEERSERLGTGIGGALAFAAGPKALKAGGSLGRGAIRAGWIDPYSVPSLSRPSFRNPIVFGQYRSPLGLSLRGNIRPGLGAGVRTFFRTGSASEAYAATVRAAGQSGSGGGNFFHILRHFVDEPTRTTASGNPAAHSVFDPRLKGSVVRLLDDAFDGSTNPAASNSIGYQQPSWKGNRWTTVTEDPAGGNLGTQLGHPLRGGYGQGLDVYTTVFDQADYSPVTMYPGWPIR